MRRRMQCLALVIFPVSLFLLAQAPQEPKPQTARQALLEMLKGDEQAITKHLTIEVQQTLKQASGKKGSTGLGIIEAFRGMAASGGNQEAFDTGSVLLAETDPKTHERFEVHVDNDDLAGDEDTLQLSLHQFRDGKEVDSAIEFISQIEIAMLRQENLWRLNAITVSAKLPLGDAKLLERLTNSIPGDGMTGVKIGSGPATTQPERPRLDAEQNVRMLSLAQGIYANLHPETGFTCSLGDLLNPSNPVLESLRLDPAIAGSSYNGYKYSISGCQGRPAGSFQIVAEPAGVSSGAKAFCTDATRNLRVSDDGHGSTCLSSGRFLGRGAALTTHVELKPK